LLLRATNNNNNNETLSTKLKVKIKMSLDISCVALINLLKPKCEILIQEYAIRDEVLITPEEEVEITENANVFRLQ
jgi:hypothetical protein